MIHAVVWTDKRGRRHRWEYARLDEAEEVAAALAKGWRKDAHVEPAP